MRYRRTDRPCACWRGDGNEHRHGKKSTNDGLHDRSPKNEMHELITHSHVAFPAGSKRCSHIAVMPRERSSGLEAWKRLDRTARLFRPVGAAWF